MVALNPRQAAIAVAAVLRASRQYASKRNAAIVPLLVGSPGIGKTTIARDIAGLLGYEGTIELSPTIYTTFDLRGLPYVRDENTKFAASDILPRSGKWLVLIDELGNCPVHEQAGFYSLLLDRRLGEYRLPEGCDIIAATNSVEDKAAANPLSSAVKTRLAMFKVVSELAQTLDYAIRKQWHNDVIGFIRLKGQELLDGFEPNDFSGGATGRGLEQLSDLCKVGFTSDPTIDQALAISVIGSKYGVQFDTFRAVKIPDAGLVYADPDSAPIVSARDTFFLYCAAIAGGCDTSDKFRQVCRYATRLPRVDAIGIVADCIAKHPEYRKTAAFTQHAVKYGDSLV